MGLLPWLIVGTHVAWWNHSLMSEVVMNGRHGDGSKPQVGWPMVVALALVLVAVVCGVGWLLLG